MTLIRVINSVEAQVNENGLYTYTFTGPPQGQAYNISIGVPKSPADTKWTVTFSGFVSETLTGPNSYGPLYMIPGDTVTITGTPPAGFSGEGVLIGVQGSLSELVPTAPIGGSQSVSIASGTVDIGIAPVITIDANGSDVTVDAIGVGSLLATMAADTTSISVTTTNQNSLYITPVANDVNVTVTTVISGVTVYLPISVVTANASAGVNALVVQVPQPGTYTLTFSASSGTDIFIFSNTGIEDIRASVTSPLISTGSATLPQALAISQNLIVESGNFLGSQAFTYEGTSDAGTLLIWTPLVGIASVVDSTGAEWPFRLVAISSTFYCFAIPLAGTGASGYSSGIFTINFVTTFSEGWWAEVFGAPPLPKLSTQFVSVPTPAVGTDWTYDLEFPARLRGIYASFVTDSTAGTRYPAFVLNFGQLYVVSFGANNGGVFTIYSVGASTTTLLTAALGAYQMASTGTDTRIFARLPDFGVLPGGGAVSIGSSTPGISTTGDQWSSISLALEPA